MLEKWEMMKGLYENNKDTIVIVLCGLLLLSWIL
jgi:hypothetical protein